MSEHNETTKERVFIDEVHEWRGMEFRIQGNDGCGIATGADQHFGVYPVRDTSPRVFIHGIYNPSCTMGKWFCVYLSGSCHHDVFSGACEGALLEALDIGRQAMVLSDTTPVPKVPTND